MAIKRDGDFQPLHGSKEDNKLYQKESGGDDIEKRRK